MPTVKPEPPPLFCWFKLPYAQYEPAKPPPDPLTGAQAPSPVEPLQ